jgi:hypothetical protein
MPPYWTNQIYDTNLGNPIIVKMNTFQLVNLNYFDPDLDDVIVSIVDGPSFTSISGTDLLISPNSPSDFGIFTVNL